MAISIKEGLRGLLGLEERLSVLERNNLRTALSDPDYNAAQDRYLEAVQRDMLRQYEAQQREMTMQNNLLVAYYHAMALREELLGDLLRRRNG